MRILLLLLAAPFALLLILPISAAIIGIGLGIFGVVLGLLGAAIGITVALIAGLFGGLISIGIIKFFFIMFVVVFIGYLITKRPHTNAVK